MKIRILCVTVLLFITILLSGCVTTATTSLKTKSGDAIKAIYSAPESKGKLPVIIYNHGTFVRKLGYSDAANVKRMGSHLNY